MKSKRWLLVFLILALLPLVSAEVIFDQPDEVYNYGDNLKVGARISGDSEGKEFLEIRLDCSNGNIILHREHDPDDAKIVKSFHLTKGFLGDIGNGCRLMGIYGNDTDRSTSFYISDKVYIDLDREKIKGEVGEEIDLEGMAVKENGESVDGTLNISIPGTNFEKDLSINRKNFSLSFKIPKVAAGSYNLGLSVYEEYNGEIMNYGGQKINLIVEQTPTQILVESNDSVVPGEKFSFKPVILDQTNNTIEGKVGVVVERKKGEEFESVYEDVVKSEDRVSINVLNIESPGYWRVTAEAMSLEEIKSLNVEKLERASFDIVNGTLSVKNTGNVRYDKPIEINIANQTLVKTFDLLPKEKIELGLSAPEGRYKISISDGSRNVTSRSYLTGGAIGVEEFSEGVDWFSRHVFVWFFLIFILGAFIFTLSYKTIKRKYYAYPVESQKKLKNYGKKKVKKSIDVRKEGQSNIENAEHSLVLDGEKEKATLLALNTGNKKAREKASEIIKNNNGAVYEGEKYLFGIFSAITTKTFDNEMVAVNVARKLKEEIEVVTSTETRHSFELAGKTVLLVEDEAIIAMNEAAVLSRYGLRVVTAHSGTKAIESVKSQPVDLILMDVDLGTGNMDGTETGRKILEE